MYIVERKIEIEINRKRNIELVRYIRRKIEIMIERKIEIEINRKRDK